MEALSLCGGFKLRLAAAEDADAATAAFLPQRVALQSTFGAFDFHFIIEMSIYSFVVLNADDKLVAFCSFNDAPSVPGTVAMRKIPDARAWARQEASDLGFLTDSLLWMEVCAMCSLTEDEMQRSSSAFMRAVFTLCPDIQAVLLPSPAQYPVFPQLFKTMSRTSDYGLLMCACLRSTVLPTMKIRRAVVEDNDELLPVIERAQKRGSPLAQVPEIAIPSQPYAVARLIAAQDKDNTVFVAEVDDKIVGLMAITALISNDYCFNFNTDDYDALTKKVTRKFEFTVQEPVAAQDSSAEATPGSTPLSTPASTPTPEVTQHQAEAPAAPSPASSNSPAPPSPAPSPAPAPPSPSPVPFPVPQQVTRQVTDIAAGAGATNQPGGTPGSTPEIKAEEAPKVRVVEVDVPVEITNAFQISMLCIEEEFENQGIDFVMSAFELETRDYCLVGFPYTSRIHPLLRLFARVPCRSSRKIENVKLPETRMMTDHPPDLSIAHLCLYLLHRDSLAPGFEVRHTMSRDADALAEFLADFKDCKSIVDLVEHPRKGCHTIVAVLSAQIVGLAMIEETVPVEALTTQFCVKSFINLEHHPPANQACVTLLALSPIFRHRRRLFLREIMRQTEKTLLYCPIFPDQDLPDVIEDMLLIPARQHVYMSPSQKWGRHPETIGPSKRALRRGSVANFSPRGLFSGFDCALYFTTHRLTSRHRIPVNSKILVAGASRTAEAFLHKLIANPLMQFTNVTLVSPCGFMGFSSSAASILDVESGPARCFSKLGIDCQVGLKSSLVTDFDREAQTITLKNGEVLSYDLFIMTTGMQDQTGCKLGISAVKEVIRADEFLARLDVITGSLEKLKVPREVLVDGEGHAVVYGSTLEAFYVIQLLLSRGLRGSNIVLCHAEKKLTNKYVHGDANILSCLLEELAWCQVAVKSGLKLVGVTTNESGSLKAAKFEAQGEEEDEKIHHELPCCLLVTCERKQVDIPLFNVMRRENIIFDGRVVVDGKFQTNDPLIYAAGTACKFSRNCGKLPKLETFCSQEVGEALAASLISRFNSHLPDVGKLWLSYLPWFPEKMKDCGGGKKWPAPVTPLLGRPKCTGGILPGGVQLFSIVLPSCHTTNWDDLRIYSMLTKFSNFYARVDIAENKQLARILYAGKVKADAWKFSQVVGLPVSLLNSLPRRYSDGSLNDIMNFLLQPWSSVLFHDDFLPFYTNLTQNVVDTSKSHPKGGPDVSSFESCDKIDPELAEAISRLVRKELLKFIEKHRLELPMYTLPRKKVDLRLLLPRVISSDDVEVVEKKKQTAAAVAAAASAALVTASDLINTAFEQLIQKAETEERDKKTIKEIVGQLVQGMEELKPVLLTLRGEGYIGPTVDHLIKEIDKKVLSISVWDESLDLEGREDEEQIKRAIQGMIGLLEQSSPVMLALDRVD